MRLPLHGSNPKALYKLFSLPVPEHYIDFSVNLNPLGIPEAIVENWPNWIEFIEDYPDSSGTRLLRTIAAYEQIADDHILLGNGGAQLITLLANYLTKKRVAIVQPTFVEYEKMCAAFQCDITPIHLQAGKWGDLSPVLKTIRQVDALFLCHPNNPTGTTYSAAQINELIDECERHRCYLIIDEAFYDFVEGFNSAAASVQKKDYVIVIRSLTKMYSIAGLRLGYVLAPRRVIASLKKIQAHWSVNALALEAGVHCLENISHAKKTRTYVRKQREKTQSQLINLGYDLSKSEVNYFLLRDRRLDKQSELIRYLLTEGIVPRHTENFHGLDGRWIRLAVKKEEENNFLLKTLTKWAHL